MSETLALGELVKKLEQNKNEELNQIKQVHEQNKNELTEYLKKSLKSEQNIINEAMEELSQDLTKLKLKRWLIPLIVGVILSIGIGIGAMILATYLANQVTELTEIEKKLEIVKKSPYSKVTKVWSNAIGMKKQPKVWKQDGLWIVQLGED